MIDMIDPVGFCLIMFEYVRFCTNMFDSEHSKNISMFDFDRWKTFDNVRRDRYLRTRDRF